MPHDDMRVCLFWTTSRGETMVFRVTNDRPRRKTACFLSFDPTKSKFSAPAAGYGGAPPPGPPSSPSTGGLRPPDPLL